MNIINYMFTKEDRHFPETAKSKIDSQKKFAGFLSGLFITVTAILSPCPFINATGIGCQVPGKL